MTFSECFWLPFRLLNQGLGFVSGHGSWRLRDHEAKLLSIAREQLSPDNQVVLDKQLSMLIFVYRRFERSTGIYHLFLSDVPRMKLGSQRFYNLAKLLVDSKGGQTWVSIGADEGRIKFIEYKKPPKPIFAHPFTVKEAHFGGPADLSVSIEEHEEEHGPLTKDDLRFK
jgi:hypothetical protein